MERNLNIVWYSVGKTEVEKGEEVNFRIDQSHYDTEPPERIKYCKVNLQP